MKHKANEARIIMAAVREGRLDKLPPAFVNPPEVHDAFLIYWRAFWDLVTCANGDGVIPWTAIEHWGTVYDLDNATRENLHGVLRKLNIEYVRLRTKKGAPPNANGNTKGRIVPRLDG